MAILAAVNFEDRLVLLEDGRELKIAKFYASPGPRLLRAADALKPEDEVDEWQIAEVFTVELPGQLPGHPAFLIFEMGAISTLSTKPH